MEEKKSAGPNWSWLALAIAFILGLVLLAVLLTILMKFDFDLNTDLFLPIYNFVYAYIAALIIERSFWDIRDDQSSIPIIKRALLNKSWIYSVLLGFAGFVLAVLVVALLTILIFIYTVGEGDLESFKDVFPIYLSVILSGFSFYLGRFTIALIRSRRDVREDINT